MSSPRVANVGEIASQRARSDARRFDGAAFDAELARFLERHPGYADTGPLDELREREYARLDASEQVYLDYTGGSLYAESQLRAHLDLLGANVLGNPHSYSPASTASTQLGEDARRRVLEFFRADPDEYAVVFTPNATGAIRLVGEAYPFAPGVRLLLTCDNHNSVNGLRQWARSAGADVAALPLRREDLRLDPCAIDRALGEGPSDAGGPARLFAYPAQSNYSGAQHPLDLVEQARASGWDVLLDCAAFAPTNRLDLSRVKPDFVPLSFYKMFGYPTGLGALVVRHEALRRLRRPWFAGGSAAWASAHDPTWHRLAPGHAGFEDGTVDYLGLPAIALGLEHLERVGIDRIHARVSALCTWLLGTMAECRHSNGRPLFRVFGPPPGSGRGATVALHLLDPQGLVHDVPLIERLAAAANISLRTGCFCNPGAAEAAQGVGREEVAGGFTAAADGWTSLEYRESVRATSGAVLDAIRVSMGIVSNFADAWWFMAFCESLRDVPRAELAPYEALPSCCT